MNDDPKRRHRRSIRLKGYDYATPGLYVVTICTQHRNALLGEVVEAEMRLSFAGAMVQTVWEELPWAYPGVEIDAFVVMPNHVHGIVYLLPDESEGNGVSGGDAGGLGQGQAQGPAPTRVGADGEAVLGRNGVGATPCGCPRSETTGFPRGNAADRRQGQTQEPVPTKVPAQRSLPDVVHRFKTLSTHRYGEGVRNLGWEPYPGRLWQRTYYEHIVRNERDLHRFRIDIEENPLRWTDDRHNPLNEG